MRQLLLDQLKGAQMRHLPSHLFFCVPNTEIPEGGFTLPDVRLNLVLSGRKRVVLPLREGREARGLKAGDAFFAPRGTWEWHGWDTKSEYLCIVARPEYLRISFYQQLHAQQKPQVLFYHTNRPLPESMMQLIRLLNEAGRASRPSALHLARALVGFAIDECEMEPPKSEGKIAGRFLEISRWLQNHLHENIGRDQTADQFRITPAYLTQIFRQMTGEGFHTYLMKLRLDCACTLLAETQLPIYLVASQSGFSNPAHFNRRFREIKGMTPGRYRDCNTLRL